MTEVISCYSGDPPNRAVSTGFVARLTEAGALDPSFGGAGLRQVGDLGSFAQGHVLPGGSVLALGSARFSCNGAATAPLVLASLTATGAPDQGFGFAGFRFARPEGGADRGDRAVGQDRAARAAAQTQAESPPGTC